MWGEGGAYPVVGVRDENGHWDWGWISTQIRIKINLIMLKDSNEETWPDLLVDRRPLPERRFVFKQF